MDEAGGGDRLGKMFARGVAAALFVCVFLVFCYKIVMRYAAHDAVAWGDEISVVLFIWIIFWANAFVVRERDQIRFDLLTRAVPPGVQRVMAVARLLLVGGIFAAALPGVVDYTLFLWRERTPVLGMRMDFVYACFGMFVTAVVVRSVWHVWGLLGSGWRERV